MSSLPKKRRASPSPSGAQGKRKQQVLEIPSDSDSGSDTEIETPSEPDPHSEIKPTNGIFHPEFEALERQSTGIVAGLLEALRDTSSPSDPELLDFVARAEMLKHIKYDKEVIIGFVGNSGEGKSSLINSLLGFKNLANEGHGACSGTHIVQEFVNLPTDCEHEFITQVFFLNLPQILEYVVESFNIVKNHFSKFKDLLPHDHEEVEDDGGPLVEEFSTVFSRMSALVSLFADSDLFRDIHAAIDTVAEYSAEDDYLKRFFADHIATILRKLDVDKNSCLTITGSDAQEITRKVHPLITPVKDAIAKNVFFSPWPIVSFARTAVHSEILQHGLVLVDLPGLTDTNKQLVQQTRSYLTKLDYTVIVSNTKRIASSPTVKEYVHDCRKRNQDNIILACTMTDSNIKLIEESSECTDQIGKPEELRKLEKVWKGHFKKLRKINEDMDEAPDDELRALNRKRKRTKDQMQKAKACHFSRQVQMRNQITRQSLEEAYTGTRLNIFCVSNSEYFRHLSDSTRGSAMLSMQETGIPAFKNFIYDILSNKKLDAIQQHLVLGVPLFMVLASAISSGSKTKLKHCAVISEEIASRCARILDEIDSHLRGFQSYTAELLAIAVENSSFWVEDAQSDCDEWQEWSPSTQRAFFLRAGNHSTKTVGARDWNKELFQIAADDLEPKYNELESMYLGSTDKEILHKVDILIEDLVSFIKDAPTGVPRALHDFCKSLKLRKLEIAEVVKRTLAKLIRAYEGVITNMKYNFQEDMLQIYQDVKELKSRVGITKDRMKLFTDRVCSVQGPYYNMEKELRSAHEKILTEHRDEAAKDVKAIFKEITQDLEKTVEKDAATSIDPENSKTISKAIPIMSTSLKDAMARFKRIKRTIGPVPNEECVFGSSSKK